MTTDPRVDPVVDEIMSTLDSGYWATKWATKFADRILAAADNAATITTVEELGRDLAAVTVSRDGWQTRAEAAEKKVAAVEALVVTAEDAPIEYRNSILTSHLRAALDGGA